jgi:hypothetical protein
MQRLEEKEIKSEIRIQGAKVQTNQIKKEYIVRNQTNPKAMQIRSRVSLQLAEYWFLSGGMINARLWRI